MLAVDTSNYHEIKDEKQAIHLARCEIDNLLPDSESLKKVPSLRKTYTRIKGHLDSQIMRILQSKVEESEDWVSLLDQSLAHIQRVEIGFQEAERECEACSSRVQQWQTIKQFNRARNNVTSALAELQLLRSLPQELMEVEEMMESDDFDEGYATLLNIHVRLVKLEETRARVISKHIRREVVLTESHHLVQSFEKIVTAWANFEDVIEENMTDCIEIAKTEPSLIVRVVRVIERQARIDRWWRQSVDKEAEKLAEMERKGEERADISGQSGYKPRQLREQALVWMQTGVEKRFQSLIAEDLLDGGDDSDVSQKTVKLMTDLREDIISIFDDVVPCFPSDFCETQTSVFDFYVQLYHKKFVTVYDLLVDKANSQQLPAGLSVLLVNWIDEYIDTLQTVGIPEPPASSLRSLASFSSLLLESNEKTFCAQIDQLAARILTRDWKQHVTTESDDGQSIGTETPHLFFNLLHSSTAMVFSLPKAKYAVRMGFYMGICINKFLSSVRARFEGLREAYVRDEEDFRSPKQTQKGDDNRDGSLDEQVMERIRMFAYAWTNNCQDLSDFTRDLETTLNTELAYMLQRDRATEALAVQQGSHVTRTSSTFDKPSARFAQDPQLVGGKLGMIGRFKIHDHHLDMAMSLRQDYAMCPSVGRLLALALLYDNSVHATDVAHCIYIHVIAQSYLKSIHCTPQRSKNRVAFDDIANEWLLLGTFMAETVQGLIWQQIAPLCRKLADASNASRVEDVTCFLSEFILTDCRTKIMSNFSERIAKDLLENLAIAYFDRLLETDGRVDSATESGLLEADLEAIGDLRETIQAEAGTDSDDTPALHRVLRALDRVSEVWKFMYGLLVCDPVEPAEIFLAFQKICSRDASCPTKLCELVLLRRKNVSKATRTKVKDMMKDRESHYDPRLQSGGQSLAENAANSGPWLCSVLSGGPARSGILCRVTSVLKLDTVLMKKHQDESAKLKDTAQRGWKKAAFTAKLMGSLPHS